MLFIFKSLYIYHLILFSKICTLLNISVKNHENIFCHKEFMGTCSGGFKVRGPEARLKRGPL